MMRGTCVCGAVTVAIDARPEFIHDCNCSLCRKVGAAWGYFPSASVTTSGDTTSFVRPDKIGAGAEVHSCRHCAATTHFELTKSFKAQNPSADQVGVNMKLFDTDELEGVEIRFPDGVNWPGDGPFGYRRRAQIMSETFSW